MTEGCAGAASSAFGPDEADRFARSSHPAQATRPSKRGNHASDWDFRLNMAGFLWSWRRSRARSKRLDVTAYYVRGSIRLLRARLFIVKYLDYLRTNRTSRQN